jgi:DNA-directed RNA polymerase specialized sigma24 family protein
MRQGRDLVQARSVLAGDRAAFEDLFERYADRVYRLACRHADDEAEARELTRKMLCRVFRDLSGYRGAMSLDAWVLVQCKEVLAAVARCERRPRRAWDTPLLL